MKKFNNNTNEDTYSDKIRGKLSGIDMILSRLGNIVTNTDGKEITQLFEIKIRKSLQMRKKKRFIIILSN